jgi:hypothetical protein
MEGANFYSKGAWKIAMEKSGLELRRRDFPGMDGRENATLHIDSQTCSLLPPLSSH